MGRPDREARRHEEQPGHGAWLGPTQLTEL